MKTSFYRVPAIAQGFDQTLSIIYPQDVWDGLELATGVLRADFREYPDVDNPVLASLSTADASITRDAPNRTVTLNLTHTQTLTFDFEKVMFDLAHIDALDVKTAIPGLWAWKIDRRVTRDV